MKKVLFIMHMPPPIHGSSVMGNVIEKSIVLRDSFDCRYVNLSTGAMDDPGLISVKKIIKVLKIYTLSIKCCLFFKPDLVYMTPCAKGASFCIKEFPLVGIVKLMGIKVVIHLHNKGVQSVQDKWYYNYLFKSFYTKIKVILLSESLYRDVMRYVDKKDVFFCPNGIPPNKLPLLKTDNRDVVHILFLSNLLIEKGVFVLLDALKILKDKGYSFSCNFVGSETHEIDKKTFLEGVIKRDLVSHVSWLGSLYDDDKERAYKSADVFVLPTYYCNECFPLVLIEAMKYGLPCVTTDEGAIKDIVLDGVTGIICKKRNSCSVADALIRLIGDSDLRKQMSQAGRMRMYNEFTSDVFEKRLKNIFTGIMCN